MAALLALALLLWPRRHAWGLSAVCWGGGWELPCKNVTLRETTEIHTGFATFVALDRQSGLAQIWGVGDGLASMIVPSTTEVFIADQVLFWNNATGSAALWNIKDQGWDTTSRDFRPYTSVYTTGGAFLALNMQTGQSMCFGKRYRGGDCGHLNLTGVTEVHTTKYSFLALDKNSGRMHCWGRIEKSGGCPAMLAGARDMTIYSSGQAFLALNGRTGEVQCWGETAEAPDACRWCDSLGGLSGYIGLPTDVYSNDFAFLALNKNTGKGNCCGVAGYGGLCTGIDFHGVTDVYATKWGAFMAVDGNAGTVQCWGGWREVSGLRCWGAKWQGTTHVLSTEQAFMLVRAGIEEPECWGASFFGGNCTDVRLRGFVAAYSTNIAFMAVVGAPAQPSLPSVVPVPETTSHWPRMSLVLGGALTSIASLLLIGAAKYRAATRARAARAAAGNQGHLEPLPPRTTSELASLRRRVEALERESAGPEQEGSDRPAGWLAWRRRAKAGRARERMARLLAQAALQAAGGPEYWGISVEQLLAFHAQHGGRMELYCRDHRLATDFSHVCAREACQHDHGDAAHRRLAPGESWGSLRPLAFDMHLVVSNLIKPMTKEHQGIVGYWARENLLAPRKVETFVSHCWNERFSDFVATLRTLRHQTVVWVCSFALPQNVDIGRVLGVDVSRSPFARALASAERVLLAVDDALEPLTRSWCCFELYLAVVKEKRLDIRAHITNPGLYQAISTKATVMDIRSCTASNAGDHSAIMKAIRGAEDVVNQRVRQHVEDTVQFITSFVP